MKTEYVSVDELKKPLWHANYILRPDLVVLSASICKYGILSPLVVNSDNLIIDGVQRWMLAKDNKYVREVVGNTVPVVRVDCDSIDARILHVSINRGRGSVVAKQLSNIVKDIVASGAYEQEELAEMLCMKYDELDIMLDGTVLKAKNISEHRYSRAWVPVEASTESVNAGPVDSSVSIERPPNADR
jgi:ParB-like chromosome segregation protein Spo0J